jgi:hypothetical protein
MPNLRNDFQLKSCPLLWFTFSIINSTQISKSLSSCTNSTKIASLTYLNEQHKILGMNFMSVLHKYLLSNSNLFKIFSIICCDDAKSRFRGIYENEKKNVVIAGITRGDDPIFFTALIYSLQLWMLLKLNMTRLKCALIMHLRKFPL